MTLHVSPVHSVRAGAWLPWSLGLSIVAVAGDSRLFRVAEWPEHDCYLKGLTLRCYLCYLFKSNVHEGKLHLASLVDKIKVIADP